MIGGHEYERLQEFKRAHKLMGEMLEGVDWQLFDICQGCGHRRVEHLPPVLSHGPYLCRHGGCVCVEFDDTAAEAFSDRFTSQRMRRPKAA